MRLKKLLEVSNLTVSFKKDNNMIQTINELSFDVNKKEILGIVGESGCGKSVTSLAITGLLPKGFSQIGPTSKIKFNGENIVEYSDKQFREIRGKDIAMIFQDPMTSLNPVFTIGFQMIEMIRAHNKVSKKEAKKMGIEMLKKVNIPRAEEVIDEYPHQLSGGMRQRVMIAIAMSCDPKLLIADEPTTALDVTIQRQILNLMRSLRENFDTSILLITHDLGVVSEVCDRVIVMYAGSVVETGTVDDLFESPKHPYTRGLLDSIPKINQEINRLTTIPGMVPQPGEIQKGCRFAERCSFAMDKCFIDNPYPIAINENHTVSCFLFESEGAK